MVGMNGNWKEKKNRIEKNGKKNIYMRDGEGALWNGGRKEESK